MKVKTKELKWVTVESNILTKYSKSKDKQTKKFPTNAAICLVNLFLTWVCMLSCFSWVQLFSTLWTLGHQAHHLCGVWPVLLLWDAKSGIFLETCSAEWFLASIWRVWLWSFQTGWEMGTAWSSTGQIFCRVYFSVGLLNILLIIILRSWIFGRKTAEETRPSHHTVSGQGRLTPTQYHHWWRQLSSHDRDGVCQIPPL